MGKLLYVIFVIVALAPSFGAGFVAIRACREARILVLEEEAKTHEKYSIHAHTYTLGGRVQIYPRIWPALLILGGTIVWLAGIIVLLFVPQP